MCAGLVADERPDAFRREEVAHRRIHVLIGALDVVSLPLQHRRKRRHGGAADANQMDSTHALIL